MKLFFLSFFLLSGLLYPNADPISKEEHGTVVKIIDGDTFDILNRDKKVLRIRMEGIDCPERKQDYYQSAKNALAHLIFKKEVRVVISGYDRNRRALGMVYSNKKNINLSMVRGGYAWHFKKYSSDTALAKAEQAARRERLGIWSKVDPKAPWEFRKKSVPASQ